MVKILASNKRVFWEALLLTVVVFFFGILIGISFESRNVENIKTYYSYSEASIMDISVASNLLDLNKTYCKDMERANFEYADKIYSEAKLLEKYESSDKISDSMLVEHKKYDILRTFLWVNEMKTVEKCGRNSHTIIYLYEYNPEDLAQKATQSVWSKILSEVKEEYGEEVLLIPIAVDFNLVSLNSIIENYNITDYPVLIIDNNKVIEKITDKEHLKGYID